MDRVEINGIWYVREELSTNSKPTFQFNEVDGDLFAHTQVISYEDDEYLLEFMVLVRNYENVMPSLEIYDKVNDLKETWDNENFLNWLVELDSEAISSALNQIDTIKIYDSLLNIIINLLKYAKNKQLF